MRDNILINDFYFEENDFLLKKEKIIFVSLSK